MKKKRKYNKKILITLSMLFTMICSVFALCKTYAYDTNNELGYTDTLSSITNGNFNSIEYKTFTNSDNQTKNYIELRRTTSANYFNYKVSSEYLETNNYFSDYALLINFDYGWYSGGEWRTYNNGASVNIIFTNSFSTYNSNYYQYLGAHTLYNEDFNYNYRTTIITNGQTNTTLFNENSDMSFSITNQNSTSYYLRIYNIDFIKQDKVTLSIYYNDLQQQYNQLLEDYETLESNYDTLNDNYTELEDNYNQLETDYNNLNDEYNNVFHFNNKNGIFEYITYVTMGTTSNLTKYYNLSLDDLKSGGYLNNGELNLTDPILSSISENYAVDNHSENFVLRINFDESRLVDLSLLNIITNMYFDPTYTNTNCYIEMNGVINNFYTYSSISTPNLIGENNKFDPFIELPSIDFNIWHLTYIEYSLSTENLNVNPLVNTSNMSLVTSDLNYVNGYASGYNNAINDKNRTINNLNETISDLRSDLRIANNEITSLRWQVANGTDTYGLNNLMWTIGSVPFESFKQIWNVNFLGVNIADFILGLITTFIGLYIIKKFFL